MNTYSITSYFGERITVRPQAKGVPVWSTVHFPGARGETAVNMGSAGRRITITGTFERTGSTMSRGIDSIERHDIQKLIDVCREQINWKYGSQKFYGCILESLNTRYYRSGTKVKCDISANIKELDI
jgi:hypothetical protein